MRMYASGIDWVANGLNALCAKTPAQGNIFLIALELNSLKFSFEEFKDLVDKHILKDNSPLNGYWRRAWHLAPYWQNAKERKVNVAIQKSDDIAKDTQNYINQPLKNQHVVDILILEKTNWTILFKFSHLIFDGTGAEEWISSLLDSSSLEAEQYGCKSANLNRWHELFRAGQMINRSFIALAKRVNARKQKREKLSSAPNHFMMSTFDFGQIHKAIELRYGIFSDGIVLASVVAKSLRLWRKQEDILIQTSINQRSKIEGRSSIFFNQWSALPLLYSNIADSDNLDLWVECGKRELGTGLSDDFCGNLEKANLLMRILPAPAMGKFISTRIHNGAGDCSASLIPSRLKNDYIANLWHIPSVPSPPSLGAFFTVYKSRLNVIISYRESAGINDKSIAQLQTILTANMEMLYD